MTSRGVQARSGLLCFVLVLLLEATARAQPSPTLAGPGLADTPSTLYRFEQLEFEAADGERHYRVQLAIPQRKAPAAGFPVLYLLDGNAAFADLTPELVASVAARGVLPVLVAIGYATELRFDTAARAYDFTPALDEAALADSVDAARGRRTGGADVFLDLIERHVKPAVEMRAPIDERRQTLWGHSYGGLFALYTFLHRPDTFQRYAAAEPSLWWGKGFVLGAEPNAVQPPRSVRLLVMTGADAGPPTAGAKVTSDPAVERMRKAREAVPEHAAAQLAARQNRRPSVRAQLCTFPDVAHGPMLARSLGPALLLAMGAKTPCVSGERTAPRR